MKHSASLGLFIAFFMQALAAFAQNGTIVRLGEEMKKTINEVLPLNPAQRFHLSIEETEDILQRVRFERALRALIRTEKENLTSDCPAVLEDEEPTDESSQILFLTAFSPTRDTSSKINSPLKYQEWEFSQSMDFYDYIRGQNPKYDELSGKSQDEFRKKQRLDVIQRVAQGESFEFLNSAQEVAALREFLIAHPTPQVLHTTLNNVKNNLTFDQKLYLASSLGGEFNKNYNYDRKNDLPTPWGKTVDIYELLESARNDEPGGVCRDIAVAQAQVLSELGVKNTYVVGYAVPGNHHASVVTQDPNNPDKIYKMDYGEVQTDTSSLEGRTNIGLTTTLNTPDGRPVAKVPTEVGEFLKRSVNAPGKQDPFMTSSAGLSRVELFRDQQKMGNLFIGQTRYGDSVVGVSVARNYQTLGDRLKSRVGVGVAQVNKRPERNFNLSSDYLYTRFQSALSTPQVQVGNIRIVGSGDIDLTLAEVKTNEQTWAGGDRSTIITADPNASLGIDGRWTSAEGRSAVSLGARTSYYPDSSDIRGGSMGMYRNLTLLRSRASHALSGDVTAVVDAAVSLREVGDSFAFRAGLLMPEQQRRISVGMKAPLTKGMARFFPGATPQCTVEAEGKLCGFNVRLIYDRALDGEQREQLGIQLKKKF